ncbi:MAG: tetratricopeptide repeat protein [Ekhidna sp.]
MVSFLAVSVITKVAGQGNCLIYPENSGERLACELSYQSIEYPQGGAMSQILFDSAIKVGPNYAYAYYEKSVPFFKRGKLIEGTKLINKAIELDPEKYLTYRAYWYFLNHSFEACISDLERFYNELNVSIMPTPGGDFEMRMLLALSYAQVGELAKAIDLVSFGIDNFDSMNYFVGAYDYHVLGILLYSNNQFEEAKKALEKQIEMNDRYAGTYYYLALTNKSLGDSNKANKLFRESLDRFDGKKDGINFNAFITYNVTRSQVVAEMN